MNRMQPTTLTAGATLTIDLDAIRQNYRLLRAKAGKAACAAVVKANAYGLGVDRVAPALVAEGCRHFFVAHVEEGMALRALIPMDVEIFVLHGPPVGVEREFVAYGLIPVLNSLQQINDWNRLGRQNNRRLPAVIQVDTGMSRMGLSPQEVDRFLLDDTVLGAIDVRFLMSHLACGESRVHEMNTMQLKRFRAIQSRFPCALASFANSSGIFLGDAYLFDLVRPGAALYGLAPIAGEANPMQSVLTLTAKIIQTRTIARGDGVGYGLHFRADRRRTLATISVGYADGWPRGLNNRGLAFIDGIGVPFAGNVSMDSITLDVSEVHADAGKLAAGASVELTGPHHSVDQVAALAGTIGYEILTGLGHRFHRIYRSDIGAGSAR